MALISLPNERHSLYQCVQAVFGDAQAVEPSCHGIPCQYGAGDYLLGILQGVALVCANPCGPCLEACSKRLKALGQVGDASPQEGPNNTGISLRGAS